LLDVNFDEADLSLANMTNAKIVQEQLAKAKTTGTLLPYLS
jgi:uncharacterized protein YjbI with pentapeptide repeats